MKRTFRNSIIAACVSIMLAACGGGGSGGSPDPDPVGTGGELAAITMDNAELTAGMVASVALGDGVFGALSGLDIPVLPGATGTVVTEAAKIATPSELMATSSGSVECAVFGSVDVDITVTNPLLPTVGDIYALQFTQCNDGEGIVVDGGMIIRITELEGDLNAEQILLVVSVELSAFQVTEGERTTGAAGTITISIDSRTPLVTTISVSTTALAVSGAGTAEAVTNMNLTISEDESVFPTAVSVDTSFTVSSPRIGGDVRVSTALTLQSSGEEYPYVGELRITGAGNSAIVLIALDAGRVRLEIDIDGDGALDESLERTWDELMALIG